MGKYMDYVVTTYNRALNDKYITSIYNNKYCCNINYQKKQYKNYNQQKNINLNQNHHQNYEKRKHK